MIAADLQIEEPQYIRVGPWAVREMLKYTKPNVHKLFSAAWALGFTVNGIPAHG
jgi:hypothetical protein